MTVRAARRLLAAAVALAAAALVLFVVPLPSSAGPDPWSSCGSALAPHPDRIPDDAAIRPAVEAGLDVVALIDLDSACQSLRQRAVVGAWVLLVVGVGVGGAAWVVAGRARRKGPASV